MSLAAPLQYLESTLQNSPLQSKPSLAVLRGTKDRMGVELHPQLMVNDWGSLGEFALLLLLLYLIFKMSVELLI